MRKVAVIGGGAAGFFAALICAKEFPKSQIVIFEKSSKTLSKVKISGGGRCNVTNVITNPVELSEHYPRGSQQLKHAFKIFGTQHIRNWLQYRGVDLKVESDGRVFPVSDDSQTIINCFLEEARKLKITIKLRTPIYSLAYTDDTFHLFAQDNTAYQFHKVIIATGGTPKLKGLQWLAKLGHHIEPPVPSLFTFRTTAEITRYSGISIPDVTVKITGTKLEAHGALLITHQGMSGPAILKLSALGARVLADKNYQFELMISWLSDKNTDQLRQKLLNFKTTISQRKVMNRNPFYLPNRFWEYLIQKSNIQTIKIWRELSNKDINRLAEVLTHDKYSIIGKTNYKQEFVTCGGISLKDVNFSTMESKKVKGLFFAGEVLDIDAVTGGFNFQGAWTTGFIAGKSVLKKHVKRNQ